MSRDIVGIPTIVIKVRYYVGRTPFGSSRGEAQFVPSDLMGRVASVNVSTCSPAASDEWASLYMALCLSIASRA